ncbi:MAG: ComEA family DNA-binding protein [Acidithiobacillus sp.]
MGRTGWQCLLLGLALLFSPWASAAININAADAAALDSLPGIGPAKAQAILAYRQAHGPFAQVEDLRLVPGIGPKLLERLRGQVSVGPDSAGGTPLAATQSATQRCQSTEDPPRLAGVIRDSAGHVRRVDQYGRPFPGP